jgi:hypothetical protein
MTMTMTCATFPLRHTTYDIQDTTYSIVSAQTMSGHGVLLLLSC